jgi:PIN domain nuclease of toxin-antitoxin system
MVYVLDTHALVWYADQDPRLSPAAEAVLDDPANQLVIPTMALVEVQFLRAKRKIKTDLADIRQRIIQARNCVIYPLTEEVVSRIPTGLNIHDSIIVATAIVYRDVRHQPVTLITKDGQIRRSGLIQTLW